MIKKDVKKEKTWSAVVATSIRVNVMQVKGFES
jgi:hypothetical protein